MDDTYERLLPLISMATGMESTEITSETDFKRDLALESLDAIEFAMQIEYDFGVKLETEDLSSLKTVGDLISYIDNKLS